MSGQSIRAMACQPWDGTWYYPLPEPGPDFWPICQFTALQILRSPVGLTIADARMLQAIATHEGPLTSLQSFWLCRLCREHDERLGA